MYEDLIPPRPRVVVTERFSNQLTHGVWDAREYLLRERLTEPPL
jgi:hypothetical protein